MNGIRFLTPTTHGALDYAAAAGLIILPLLLGFSGLALWLSVAGGGWEASLDGFPALSVVPGQFLLKDIVLLAASLSLLGKALDRRSATPPA